MSINPEIDAEGHLACWEEFDECMGFGEQDGDGNGDEDGEDQCRWDEERGKWLSPG